MALMARAKATHAVVSTKRKRRNSATTAEHFYHTAWVKFSFTSRSISMAGATSTETPAGEAAAPPPAGSLVIGLVIGIGIGAVG
eukprot:3871085-Pyramimonas_sp.AAC.1